MNDVNAANTGVPASGGQSEDYKTLVEKLEREKNGMYGEMKAEREKRQAMEEKMSRMEQEFNSRFSTVAPQDESMRWITEFAQKPREVYKREFEENIKPLKEQNIRLVNALAEREALEYVAEEEGVTVAKLKKSGLDKELMRVAKDHNLFSMDVVGGTKAAYELYKLEKRQKEESEKARSAAIQNQATQPLTQSAPPNPNSGRVWKESDIAKMDLETFKHHQKDITLAKSEGRIVADLSSPQK